MDRSNRDRPADLLPDCAAAFIDLVTEKIRYRKKVRQEVRGELVAHFEDELRDNASEQDREQKARRLVAEFGDPKVLAALVRRAKKRCRPLWAKVLVRCLQAIGAVFLYLQICALPLIIGRPTIRVNYLDWINDLVRAGRDESLNARPSFDRAAELAAKVPWPPELLAHLTTWPGDMNDQQRKATADFLDKNTQAFDVLRDAVRKPYCWRNYQLDPETRDSFPQGLTTSFSAGLVRHATEPLGGYRDLTRRLRLESEWKAYTGDLEGSLRDCLDLVRFGVHLEGKGLLIEQLVGAALDGCGQSCLFNILDKTNPSAGILKGVQQELEGLYSSQKVVVSLDTEKALQYEYVQRTFTDDGKGNGRVLRRGVPLVASDWRSLLAGLLLFRYPDRREVTRQIDGFFEAAERQIGIMPSSDEWEGNQHKLNEIARGNPFLQLESPTFPRMAQLAWHMKTHRAALVTTLGVIRYQKETGQYPTDLNELVAAGYLNRLPIDPYSGRPLVYRQTDGGFLLYSLGTNLKDNGGKLGTDSQGRPRMWADNGDWVFWPVNKE